MKKKSNTDKQNDYEKANKNIEKCLEQMSNAYSAYDCTGLIPSKPTNDAEIESYNEVYNYLPSDTDSILNNSKF